jgi:hypothetical protein
MAATLRGSAMAASAFVCSEVNAKDATVDFEAVGSIFCGAGRLRIFERHEAKSF